MDGDKRPMLQEVVAVAADVEYANLSEARHKRQQARRAEVLALSLAGLNDEQIAEQLTKKGPPIEARGVRALVERTLERAVSQGVEAKRELENQRLDRAQAAIWPNVLAGDYRAVMTYLAISQRRAKMNGMDAPASVTISTNVRSEMEQALADLSAIVLESEATIVGSDVDDVS